MPSTDSARQIATTDKQIADTEARIIQLQKRVENLLAKGADADDERTEIAELTQTLKTLEARKTQFEQQQQRGRVPSC